MVFHFNPESGISSILKIKSFNESTLQYITACIELFIYIRDTQTQLQNHVMTLIKCLSPTLIPPSCPLTSCCLCCRPSNLRWQRFLLPSKRWSPCCSPTPAHWVRTWQPAYLYQRSAGVKKQHYVKTLLLFLRHHSIQRNIHTSASAVRL